ncbi:MAG: DNA methyltransferase, partial [Deltaproteobacteria bacterium RIFCSPLOWO2_02_FULL_53_8]
MLNSYLKKLTQISNRGDAREETYYSALNDLLGDYASSTGRHTADVTVLPKQTEAGNPDFRVWDGKQHITGYIETKDPSVENLDRIEDTAQLKRYLHTFPNLILTNFLEFRLYRNGELTDTVSIGRPVILRKLKTAPPIERESEILQLLEKFFSFSIPKVYDAKSLAVELAKRTRFLKDEVIAQELREEEKTGKGFIRGFYKAFRDYLISGLTEDEFADLYAQTITYGLFAARTRAEGGFNRKLAYDNIPQTIGILREVFQFVSLGKLPCQMEWIIDDISEVLSVTDINKILHQYFHEGKGKDPIVHFYETFLSEYDPKTRKVRGVYYTPEPVVSYIVSSLHSILKEQFNRPDGFADRNVTVLDPAAGTLTFLAETAKLAVDEFVSKYGDGGKERFIKDHIIKNFYAFEWMMAPYAVGHLKMSFLLEELGYGLRKDDRVKLYLTNTLEMEELGQTELPGMASLSEESHLAGKVKNKQPILVILGNPPYSGHSSNTGEWISKEIRAYYQVDGKPLGEKNPKWLQDDYVKFLRFAQWKIDQAGEGVVGFITNHGYLDNPTFRGMRQSLMTTFNEIRILDLHGNSLKKEKCHDGSKDENVFDIQQGVAIAIFIKKKGIKKAVYHAELRGKRADKYSWLQTHDIKTTQWKHIAPKSEGWFFIPRNEDLAGMYEKYWKVTDIFPVNGVGMTTARDEFVIDFDKSRLLNRIRLFKNNKYSDDEMHSLFNINKKKGWSIRKAWNMLQDISDSELKDYILPVLYRPFDVRNIFYHDSVVWRTVKKVMQHMMRENLGLITNRQVNGDFKHTLCSNIIINDCTVSLDTRERSYLFPLYLYEKGNPFADASYEKRARGDFKKDKWADIMTLFEETADYCAKRPNIAPLLLEELSTAYKTTPSPEEVFHYIYAILYSNTYRTRYAEFLKTDFPRVPFTKDYKLFKK